VLSTLIESLIGDFQERPFAPATRRDARPAALPGKIDVLIGMRRSGKSWRMGQAMGDLVAAGTPKARLLHINFDDERLLPMATSDLQTLPDTFFRLFPDNKRERCHFFFDEIQNVPGWEAFVRRLLDTENVQITLTGSSAKLLSRDIASALRGRSLATEIFPFSFAEALRHQGEDDQPAEVAGSARRARLAAALRAYLVAGGFPEVQGLAAHQRVAILQEYVDVVILRDVVERHGVSNVAALRRLIRRLLGHPATPFSIHRFHQDLQAQGVACGKNALHEMLDHLTDAFLVQSVDIDTRSERQRLVNPRKVYPIDTGLAQAFHAGADTDLGRLLETLVFLDLRRRGHEIHYFRSEQGLETDFIARPAQGGALAIQVTASLAQPATRERELRGLRAAMQARSLNQGTIVTLDENDQIRADEGDIRVVPAWRWLLREEPGADTSSAFAAPVA
jgi:predicted AAA+ superfamily ATPase